MKNNLSFKLFLFLTVLTVAPANSNADPRPKHQRIKHLVNPFTSAVDKVREKWGKWLNSPFIGIDSRETAGVFRKGYDIERLKVDRANQICRDIPGGRYKGALDGATDWSREERPVIMEKLVKGTFVKAKTYTIYKSPRYVWDSANGEVEITKDEYLKRKRAKQAVSIQTGPAPIWVINELECTDDPEEVAVFHPSNELENNLVDDDRPHGRGYSRLHNEDENDSDDEDSSYQEESHRNRSRDKKGYHPKFENNRYQNKKIRFNLAKSSKFKKWNPNGDNDASHQTRYQKPHRKNDTNKQQGQGVELSEASLQRLIDGISKAIIEARLNPTPPVRDDKEEPSLEQIATWALDYVKQSSDRADSLKASSVTSSLSPSSLTPPSQETGTAAVSAN